MSFGVLQMEETAEREHGTHLEESGGDEDVIRLDCKKAL